MLMTSALIKWSAWNLLGLLWVTGAANSKLQPWQLPWLAASKILQHIGQNRRHRGKSVRKWPKTGDYPTFLINWQNILNHIANFLIFDNYLVLCKNDKHWYQCERIFGEKIVKNHWRTKFLKNTVLPLWLFICLYQRLTCP